MSNMVTNLKRVYKMATPEHIKAGKLWYTEAHAFCVDLAIRHNVEIDKVVGILSVLSPQVSWPVNKQAAQNLLATGDCPGYTGYKANIAKARNILQGGDIQQTLGHGTRYGAKVQAFFDNIRFPTESFMVTVDTHALRAAFDIVDVPRALSRAVFESSLNAEIQLAYKHVALGYNLRPCQLQAIIWLVVKDNLSH